MKKISLSILMVVIAIVCFAQPKIEFEQTTYEFGKIKEEGGKVTGRFVFTNVGTEDLVLTNVRPGCGCTAANYSKDPVAPGQKGYIEATYNPYNRPGIFNKNIRVTTNEPQFSDGSNAAPHMIFIKGEVIKRPPTEFEQAGYTKTTGMARFFEASVNKNLMNTEIVQDTFKVRNFWTKPVSYTLDNSRAPFIREVSRSFGQELAPKQEGFIVLEYDATRRADFGQLKDMVLYNTNDSIEPRKQIHYAVNIKEDFSKLTKKQIKNAPVSGYDNTALEFGEVAKNTNKTMTVKVSNTGKDQLIIRNISASSNYFKVTSDITEIPAGGSATITVLYKAPSRLGDQKGTIDVITNDPANPIQIITVHAKTI